MSSREKPTICFSRDASDGNSKHLKVTTVMAPTSHAQIQLQQNKLLKSSLKITPRVNQQLYGSQKALLSRRDEVGVPGLLNQSYRRNHFSVPANQPNSLYFSSSTESSIRSQRYAGQHSQRLGEGVGQLQGSNFGVEGIGRSARAAERTPDPRNIAALDPLKR